MKKIIFVIVSILSMIGLIFYFGLRVYNSRYSEFLESGYIISQTGFDTESVQTTKYYFSKGTKYKKNYDNNYVFETTDKSEVEVFPKSFVHYMDGSITTLNKAAILDLDNLDVDVLKYYSFYVGSRLRKDGTSYTAQNLNKTMKFSNFLMKIDENKYMLIAPKITIKVADNIKEVNDSYIELQFFDGNIIRIQNQEMEMQNISSNFYIELPNNVKINLANKNIFLGDEKVLNMASITINSDDNIEIPPEEKVEEEDKKNPLDGLLDGKLPGNVDDNEEEVDTDGKLNEPFFRITNMNVTSNKFTAEVRYEDLDNLLVGDINLMIIETGSNKIVYQTRETTGIVNFLVDVENLYPNTNYVFVVNANYMKGERIYNRDFIQKTFVTEAVGVDLVKNYFTTNELSFYITNDEYSKIESVKVSISDMKDQVLKYFDVPLGESEDGKTEVLFNELEPNTEYKVKVYDFLYDNSIITSQLSIEKNYKTLKQKPNFGELSYTIDKKNSLFTLKANNIDDFNNGIISYRYEIYDARTLKDEPVVIQTIEKNNKGSVDLSIDNRLIYRGTPYVYKMIALFDDNEKQYEYQTGYSEVMQMDGVDFPSIRFETKEVTFERIVGNLIITDNGNTIDFSKVMTIIYADSVGNSKSITTSGNATIPFSQNGLRANETYTISLYATVNLQDGNEAIDNCFVGSVIVKTEPTKPFMLDYNVDTSDVSRAFLVKARLVPETGNDTTLEANTLSNLTFNLYAGTTTSGRLIRTVTKIDRNGDEYVSELKANYYDKQFEIDPAFFGQTNDSLNSEYYTIEVTQAHDYTNHKNPIEIKKNLITVKVNGYIPSLPDEPSNAVEVNVIRNKDMADGYRNDLNADTIVGYKIKANYDNTNRYARMVHYKLHDSLTDEVIETADREVLNDGLIDYVYFYLKDGTNSDDLDTEFRRGNRYYITYTVDLDLNFDGVAETIYPIVSTNVVLKSKPLEPTKQSAIIKTYPSTSSNTSFTWKYVYSDIDNVLIDKSIYYKIGFKELGKKDIAITDDYKSISFPIDTAGNLTLYVKEEKIKGDEPTDSNLVYQYYELPYLVTEKQYEYELQTNRIIFKLLDYSNNTSFYSRVAGAKVIFTSGVESVTLDNLLVDEYGNIVVDLADIELLINKSIDTKLYLYYDSGVTGYDTQYDQNDPIKTKKFSFQMIKNNIYNGDYFYYNDDMILQTSPIANKSLFTFSLNKKNNTLTLTDIRKEKNSNLKMDLSESGFKYRDEIFLPKQLNILELAGVGQDKLIFDTIIPGITLLDMNGKERITPGLSFVNLGITLYGNSANRIKDDKIYIEIYEKQGLNATLLKTEAFNTSNLNSIRIEGLQPKTSYEFKVFANVKTGATYERMQLYDINEQDINQVYDFSTLGSVGISNIRVNYSATSYEEKYLTVNYYLQELVGYEYITYEVYKIKENADGSTEKTLIELDIDPDYTFTNNMTHRIKISSGSGVVAGEDYLIMIRAYTTLTIDGEEVTYELEPASSEKYSFLKLINPYFGISSSRDENGTTINYNVNVYDYQRAIVGDTYQVRLEDVDGNDITPNDYKGKTYSTKDYNKLFQLKNLEHGKEYWFKIIYKLDVNNDVNSIQTVEKKYHLFVNSNDGINVGEVSLTANFDDPSKINLIFSNSYQLNKINTIRYSIYSNNSGFNEVSVDGLRFLPNVSIDNTYYFTLPDKIDQKGVYYIQIQFLSGNKIIAEESLRYVIA